MKNLKTLSSSLLLFLFLMNCSSDDYEITPEGSDEFNGSIESIENFYSAELLAALDDLGFEINTGSTPPDITGQFSISPITLLNSNFNDSYAIGHVFSNGLLSFSNQDNQTLTIDVHYEQGSSTNIGVQSYISGNDDLFSAFLKVESIQNGHTSIIARAFSGKITQNGIEDFYEVLVMLDDNGDPNNNLIENNQGRLFYDADGISERQ